MPSRVHLVIQDLKKRTANDVSAFVHAWFLDAMGINGMQQSILADRLTAALDRKFSRQTVHLMVAGQRSISADEMLAIASICRVPLPALQAKRHNQPRLPGVDVAEPRAL